MKVENKLGDLSLAAEIDYRAANCIDWQVHTDITIVG